MTEREHEFTIESAHDLARAKWGRNVGYCYRRPDLTYRIVGKDSEGRPAEWAGATPRAAAEQAGLVERETRR